MQVVGLTASVGVGRANSDEMAQKHIQKMMANLDAEELSTVNECLPELTEHVIVAEQGTINKITKIIMYQIMFSFKLYQTSPVYQLIKYWMERDNAYTLIFI